LNRDKNSKELTWITQNAGISMAGILFMNMMAFVNNVIITRNLGVDQYGLFVLATNVFGFLSIFPMLGFENTILRFVSFYIGKGMNEKAKGTILFSVRLLLVVSFVFLFIFFLLAPIISIWIFERRELGKYLGILLIALPFGTLSGVFYASLAGLKLIRYQVLSSNILNPLIMFFLLTLIFWAGFKLDGLIWLMVLMSLVNACIAFAFLYSKYFKGVKGVGQTANKRELINFATPLYFNLFLNSAIRYSPVFIIGYFLANKELGIFNVSLKVALFVSISLNAFRLAFSPTISGLFAKKNKQMISKLYKSVTKWIFTLALTTIFIIYLFTENILMVFGQGFVEGVLVLVILATGELFNAGSGLSGNILIMSGRPKIPLINSIFNFMLITVLSFVFIPKYGILGAAFAYSISMITVNIIRLLELYYFEKMHPFSKSYFKPLIAGVFAYLSTEQTVSFIKLSSYRELMFGTVLFILLFSAFLWLLKIDNDDKYVFRTLLRKNRENRSGK
jgi:O-antigen/teichoic acid export membrane protein